LVVLEILSYPIFFYWTHHCYGSVTFWYRMDPDPQIRILTILTLLFSSVTFKTPTKNNYFFVSFYAHSFLKVHLHNFSMINILSSHKTVEIKVFLHFPFLLSWIRIQEAQKHTDPGHWFSNPFSMC
jgi:hypothetical protein